LTIILLSGCGDPVEKIKQGESCVDCDLRNVDLSGTSLIGIDLSGSDLSGADLSNVKIGEGTKFENANLSNATLENATINENEFPYSVFDNTNLSNANLTNAQINAVHFRDSDLSGANLSYLNLSAGCRKIKGTSFDECVRFSNSNLSNANLSHVDATLVRFDGVNFTDASLVNFRVGGEVGMYQTRGKIEDIVFPSFDNPEKLLSDAAAILRKTTKSNRARAMLFNVDAGMTNQLADDDFISNGNGRPERRDQDGHLLDIYGKRNGYGEPDGVIKIINYLRRIDSEPTLKKQIEGTFTDTKNGRFNWKNISDQLCEKENYDDPYIVMDKEVALSKFSKFLEDEGDKELILMILDHLELGTTYGCENEDKVGLGGQSPLENFAYDYYNKMIEISKIGECEQTIANPITAYKTLKEKDFYSPKTSLGLSILSQNASQYHEEVMVYNECINSAYKTFVTGVNSVYDSLVRVTVAVNMESYLDQVASDQVVQRKLAATKKFRDQVITLVKQLYEPDDLISEWSKIASATALLESAMNTDPALLALAGDGNEIVQDITKAKESAFRRSMNWCLRSNFSRETDEKKRSGIIRKLQNAVKNKYSDDAVNKIIEKCTYDANVAYMSR